MTLPNGPSRCNLHIIDTDPNSLSANGWLEDTSKVQKYVMSDEDYNSRENSYRKVSSPRGNASGSSVRLPAALFGSLPPAPAPDAALKGDVPAAVLLHIWAGAEAAGGAWCQMRAGAVSVAKVLGLLSATSGLGPSRSTIDGPLTGARTGGDRVGAEASELVLQLHGCDVGGAEACVGLGPPPAHLTGGHVSVAWPTA
jgi:hypothetical protein